MFIVEKGCRLAKFGMMYVKYAIVTERANVEESGRGFSGGPKGRVRFLCFKQSNLGRQLLA